MNIKLKKKNLFYHIYFKILCQFSFAVLGTMAFSFLIWQTLAAVLHAPTPEQVEQTFGLISLGYVKPEPIENYTFFLTTGVGIFLFGFMAYRAAVHPLKLNCKR